MLETISEAAEEIRQLLNNDGPLHLSAVAHRIRRPQTLIYMGLGWLARENKLVFTRTMRGTAISLKERAK